MKGKLKVKGNMSLAMKFNNVLTATRKQLEKTKGSAKPKGEGVPRSLRMHIGFMQHQVVWCEVQPRLI
jgi:hypothetical protein